MVDQWWSFSSTVPSRMDSCIPCACGSIKARHLSTHRSHERIVFHSLIAKIGSAKITRMLHANDLLPGTVDYLSPTEVGGKSKTGPMPQEHKDKISKSKTGVKRGRMHQ